MKNLMICLALILTTSVAFAKARAKRTVAQTSQTIVVSAVHGDLLSQFTIENKGNAKFSLRLTQSTGNQKNREITQNDFNFILEEFGKLPISNLKPTDCYRAKINAVLFTNGLVEQKKASCFGTGTVTEPAYARFSQILLNAL
jgi:hypothetical protein